MRRNIFLNKIQVDGLVFLVKNGFPIDSFCELN